MIQDKLQIADIGALFNTQVKNWLMKAQFTNIQFPLSPAEGANIHTGIGDAKQCIALTVIDLNIKDTQIEEPFESYLANTDASAEVFRKQVNGIVFHLILNVWDLNGQGGQHNQHK